MVKEFLKLFKKYNLIGFLIFFGIFYFSSSWAQVNITEQNTFPIIKSIGKNISFYSDSSNTLDLGTVVNFYKSGKFQKNNEENPNFGYQKKIFWFHLELYNNSSITEFIIESDFANYNYFNLFLFDSNFVLLSEQYHGVYNLNKNKNKIINRCPAFDIKIDSGKSYHLFFQVKSDAPIILPLRIHNMHSFINAEKDKREIFFLLFGIIFATVIFNTIFFFIAKNRAYIFLALHLLLALGNFIFYFGYGLEYFPYLNPYRLLMLKFDFYALAGVFHGLFFISYLELKKFKTIFYIYIISIAIDLLMFILSVAGLSSVYNIAIHTISNYFVFSILNIVVAFFVFFKKQRSAGYYLIAFGIHILASIIFVLTTIGKIDYSDFNLSVQVIAIALFGILLSIGLTEQFTISNKIKAAKAQLEKDNILLTEEIEERRQIEKKLVESENKFRTMFELMPHPIILSDLETGKVIDVNNSLCEVTGYKKEELIGNFTTKIGFWDNDYRQQYICELKQNGKIFGKETTIKIKNNQILTVLMYSEIIQLQNKIMIFTVAVDISELKKQEEILALSEKQLQILNKTKDKFFSVIAHDLQNPMQVMLAYCREMTENIESFNNNECTKLKKYALTIKEIAENTNNLLQNLLAWARIQTGLIKFHPEPVHTKSLVTNIQAFFRKAAGIKNIIITYEYPDDLVLFGDINMLQAILRNLVANAIKYTYMGGRIVVSVSKDDTNFIMQVTDNGIGISEDMQKKLFKIGEVYQSRGTNDELGTGLGLILCAEFIQLHKGQIHVKSSQGNGSEFTVIWPINFNNI